ncbi:MAG: hypothetical protein HC929_25355 [Leptolyngbyaceae cyanobacterium SM2_5_2]|nr:hypothetical protein [Leptolyngbyaceae cyanobacterium SM2_5_2]
MIQGNDKNTKGITDPWEDSSDRPDPLDLPFDEVPPTDWEELKGDK